MRVFVVEENNGESNEDFNCWLGGVYLDYRKATTDLLDDGFELVYGHDGNETVLEFFKIHNPDKIEQGYPAEITHSTITEVDVIE